MLDIVYTTLNFFPLGLSLLKNIVSVSRVPLQLVDVSLARPLGCNGCRTTYFRFEEQSLLLQILPVPLVNHLLYFTGFYGINVDCVLQYLVVRHKKQ